MQQLHEFSFAENYRILPNSFRSCRSLPQIRSKFLFRPSCSSFSRNPIKISNKSHVSPPVQDLRKLTSRIVELTRRKRLSQIFDEVELAKKQYGNLNTIVMNAVMEACVSCGDVDSAIRIFHEMTRPENCGVDNITYAIFLKGLGEARRIDEAFQILESIEQGTAVGSPTLSQPLIYGLLNSLLEAGDMRRANGLLARYRFVLQEAGPSILLYNLLIKGHTNSDAPINAFTLLEEMKRQGLKPDRLTYNTLISAYLKLGKVDAAMQLLSEMKEEALKCNCALLFPDVISYTTILKGLADIKDLLSVREILVEMKSLPDLCIDRTAYTTMVDTLLACGSTKGALCIFGEIIKRAGQNPSLKPKPHLYLSMMRTFAAEGNFNMVKCLHKRMMPESVGTISPSIQLEADELLMEAAINDGQIDVAKRILSDIIFRWQGLSWSSRAGLVAIRVEASYGTNSMFTPFLLPQISITEPIERYMTPFEDARPLQANLKLKQVAMRLFKDAIVPIVDDWGSCIGLLHREDCREMNSPLSKLMRGPPPCVTTSTSIGRAVDLILEKKYKMIIIVKSTNFYGSSYSSAYSKAVGVFTFDQLYHFAIPATTAPDSLSSYTSFTE